jgi:spore coat protein SA
LKNNGEIEMRVVVVGTERLPIPPVVGGAIQKWIQSISRPLSDLGNEIIIISPSVPLPSSKSIRSIDRSRSGIEYLYLNADEKLKETEGLSYYRTVAKELEGMEDVDLIHVHNRPSVLPMLNHRKLLLTLHNTHEGWKFTRLPERLTPRRQEIYRLGLRKADAIAVNSNFLKSFVASLYHIPPCKISVIPNGVDTHLYRPRNKKEIREVMGLPTGPLILFVGRIIKKKGVHFLIDAFLNFKEECSEARLLIVGPLGQFGIHRPSPYATKILQLAKREHDIIVMDPIYSDKLAQVYSCADLFVLPSDCPEAFGMVALEAMSSGLPVVASKLGGLPELVDDGVTGLLVPPRNTSLLTKAIVSLIEDEAYMRRLGEAGRWKAIRFYEWSSVARAYNRIYRDLALE